LVNNAAASTRRPSEQKGQLGTIEAANTKIAQNKHSHHNKTGAKQKTNKPKKPQIYYPKTEKQRTKYKPKPRTHTKPQ
jgi:hypothetical protein